MSFGRRMLLAALHKRSMRQWARAAKLADAVPLDRLHRQRTQARALRAALDRYIALAEDRLALPGLENEVIEAPTNADWRWRPSAWRRPMERPGVAGPTDGTRLDEDLTLFHDGTLAEVTLRQRRNTGADSLAPFGLEIDVLGFEGSFLSLCVALPRPAVSDLRRDHVIRADLKFNAEAPLTAHLRLNIRQEPNVHRESHALQAGTPIVPLDFDLFYKDFDEQRAISGWLDIIFETPRMNAVTLGDLVLSRFPRAQV